MKFKHDIEAQAGFKDKDGQLGAAGQILSSTGSQTDWITQGDIVAGNADRALSLTMTVKNSTGTTIPTGSVVCFDNSVATPSGNVITVKLADNNGTDSMPAVGVTNGAIADGAEGIAIMFGKASGFNTSSFSTGDALYVSDTPGAFTTTKPTDVKYIQRIGIVVKVHASNGTIEVFGAGRVNDVPTPLYIDHANQRLGIGTTNPNDILVVSNGTGEVRFGGSNGRILSAYQNGSLSNFDFYANQTYFNSDFLIAPGKKISTSNGSNDNLYLTTTNASKAIYTDRSVGIGTTSPSEKLQVNNGKLYITESANASTANLIYLENSVVTSANAV